MIEMTKKLLLHVREVNLWNADDEMLFHQRINVFFKSKKFYNDWKEETSSKLSKNSNRYGLGETKDQRMAKSNERRSQKYFKDVKA
ncbi:hypothetical protein Tco_0969682 [Tanacetum coccineum]